LHLTSRDPNSDEDGEENTGIINTYVLNRSDLGFMKMMTLFQDLSNPLFDEIKFDKEAHVRQFLDGCSFALEQFHMVQADYLKNLKSRQVEMKAGVTQRTTTPTHHWKMNHYNHSPKREMTESLRLYYNSKYCMTWNSYQKLTWTTATNLSSQ